MGSAIAAEQIQTLSSLAAQAIPSGYTATGLPGGLSISASGRITGKPSAVGTYSVTVTPPAGAAPASMAFTWDVHGTIAPSTVNRASTAGTPVWFREPRPVRTRTSATLPRSGRPACPGMSMTSPA